MAYSVVLSLEVRENISGVCSYIAQDSAANARHWRQRLRERLRTLINHPTRHEIAHGADAVGRDVRQTFFGVYRILYTIDGERVVVLSLRHGARLPLTPEDVRQISLDP